MGCGRWICRLTVLGINETIKDNEKLKQDDGIDSRDFDHKDLPDGWSSGVYGSLEITRDHLGRRRIQTDKLSGKTIYYNEQGEVIEEKGATSKPESSEGTSGAEKDIPTQDVDIDNLPDGWTRTDNNGRTHVRDENGNIRARIDPPDKITDYRHRHNYDKNGNSLDKNGNIVDRKSPDAHIPYNGK